MLPVWCLLTLSYTYRYTILGILGNSKTLRNMAIAIAIAIEKVDILQFAKLENTVIGS